VRRHPKRLAEAGITPARYDELRSICRQYHEYRREAAAIARGEYDRRRGSGAWHQPDPTGDEALRRADNFAARRVAMIEGAARTVDRTLAPYIVKSACEGLRFEFVRPPCGLVQFYNARLAFFVALDAALRGGLRHGN
jgi:hypothetical protein